MKAVDLTFSSSAAQATAPTALSWILRGITAIIVYVISYSLLTAYVGGDQAYYTLMYDLSRHSPLDTMSEIQRETTGSSEPLFGLIIWCLSRLGDKVVIISLCNVILVYQIFSFYQLHKVPPIVYILTVTNFYIFVLFTSAERLKFAMILIMLFSAMRSRARYIALASAIFVHFQTVIFCVSMIAPYALPAFQKTGRTKNRIHLALASIVFLFVVSFSYGSAILDKLAAYSRAEAASALPSVIILAICMVFSRNKIISFLTIFPLVIFAFILGGDRVNMITFIMYVYISIRDNNCKNPIFIAIMLYFSYRSWEFSENIYYFGNGFVSLQGALQ